jgi:hypothetical protein
MKKLLLLGMVLISVVSYGQSYTFKKCFTQLHGLPPTTAKISGEVILTDTTILTIQNGVSSVVPIRYVTNLENTKQFISNNEQMDIRYSLVQVKDENLLVMEVKDKFTNSISRITYYLNKKN